jgi:acetyl esterase/lipase
MAAIVRPCPETSNVAGVGRLLAVVVLALVLAPAADAFTKTDLRLRMSDGVELAATLYLPDAFRPGAGWPAVMAFHGLGQTRATMNAIAEAYFVPRGYAVLTVDARGHGESSGLNGLDGPRDVQDVHELFHWLAARGDIDAARIGAVGLSLGGGLVWRAAATGVPFAAIVPIATWTDLYGALFPGNLAKSGAVFGFLSELPADRFSPEVTTLENDLLHSTNLGVVRALCRERSVGPLLAQVRAPALVVQGRRDFEFDLGQAQAPLHGLQGLVRLYLGDLGHPPAPNPPAEPPHVFDLAGRWFDRWLRGIQNGVDRGPRVELAPDPLTGRTFRYQRLPPTERLRVAFPGRRTIGGDGEVVRAVRLPTRRLETFGAPVLRVATSSSTGWPRLVAELTAVTPHGKVVVADGGTATPTIGPRARQVTLRLTNQSTLIGRGSRLRLTLGTSSPDLLYLHFPLPQGVKVTIGRVRLTLPVLRRPISR